MKLKLFVSIVLFLLMVACTPTAVSPEPEIASRPTVIATAVAQPTEPSTLEPSPTAVLATPTPVPPPTETAVPVILAPRFDKFLPFAQTEGGSNSLTGLVQGENGWQIVNIPYPSGLDSEELGFAPAITSVDSDYAPATNRVLAWTYEGGAGPGSIAVGKLLLVNVGTGELEVILSENVVAAGWAPNGLDFAYILATDETYELRWHTAAGDDRLLAVDVPHSLRISPDGRTVAFTRESHYELPNAIPGLYVVEIETGLETQVSPLDRAGYGGSGLFWKPQWTPDSSQLFLYAAQDDDRAPEAHPAGYVWAAVNGSFSHFLPESAFLNFFTDEPLRDPENYRCLDSPPLFAANKLVIGIGECQPFVGIPETSQSVHFTLDPQTGTVTLSAVLLTPDTAQLLTWDMPSESVLISDDGEIISVGIESVETE